MFWWRRKTRDQDLERELRSDLELEAEEQQENGLSADETRYAAQRAFGNTTLIKEETREMWGWSSVERIQQDLRYALRQLSKNKAFTLVVVATVALGIGANTAIFTLVHAVMFNTLPVARPSELYRLGAGNNCCVMTGYQNFQDFALFSYDLYKTLRDGTPEVQHLAAFQAAPQRVSVRRTGHSQLGRSFTAEYVSSNYFDLFGIHPALGNFFNSGNEKRSNAMVAVVSYRAWDTQYGRDPGVIGSSFLIKGRLFTIVGIAPPGFYGETLRSDPPDFWMPVAAEPLVEGSNSLFDRPGKLWLYLMGRLPQGVHRAEVESKINIEARRWFYVLAGSHLSARIRREIDGQFIPLTPASGGIGLMSIAYHDALLLLMSLSALVLLTACGNVANLLLARGTRLRAQICLRLALGASRGRITRQALTDSVLMAVLGGAAGLALAFAATRLILLLAFRGAHYVPIRATPSLAVLGFALAVSVGTGLLFGIWPGWVQTHSDPADALRGASRSTPASATLPQRVLVIGQAALSLILLVGTGLLSQSLLNLEHQHFGFRPDHRILVELDPAFSGYTAEQLAGTYRRLEAQLSQIPGVRSASLSKYTPMTGNNWNDHIYLEGGGSAHQPRPASYDFVSPGYFETIGTKLLQGRSITEYDQPSSQRVAVVSQAFAVLYFKNQNPIGKRFGVGGPDHASDYEIVGMVEDAKYNSTYRPAYPTFFLPLFQMDKNPDGSLSSDDFINAIVLHVDPSANNVEPLVRRTIEQVDSNISVLKVISYETQLSLQFNQERLIATLTQLFGFVALALASVGLYGLVTLSVAGRTAEIGVRIALGATRGRVVTMLLRGAMFQVCLGLAISIPLTLAGARLIQHRLFGISGHDSATMAGAAVLLCGCAGIAALLPARRAARLDPMSALRVE